MTISNNKAISFRVEFIAALSTYLTMSYIFIVNPLLLSKAGINLSAAFAATVFTATVSTLLMAWPAKVPFAAAPVPSITTFFVGYVCLTLNIPWEAGLAAVFVSGILSVCMAYFSVRGQLTKDITPAVSTGVVFALCGFLVATGLRQADIVTYTNGFIEFVPAASGPELFQNWLILLIGLCATVFFTHSRFKLPAAPLIGILLATLIALLFGKSSKSEAQFSVEMFSTIGKLDFTYFYKAFQEEASFLPFLLSILIFFIIDFFAGVGKFIGLFGAIRSNAPKVDGSSLILEDPAYANKFEKSLYVDGVGNMFGAFFGASSVAVFVSSAVGIAAGGRTGLTACFIAILMASSLIFIPLVGSIPLVATSGILIFIGFLLIPVAKIRSKEIALSTLDIWLGLGAGALAFFTYSMDIAILAVFSYHSILVLKRGPQRKDTIFLVTTALLLSAVVAKFVLN